MIVLAAKLPACQFRRMTDHPTSADIPASAPTGPAISLPVLGILWLAAPVVSSTIFGASDWGVTILYLWAWSIIVPALALGIGALVIRYRHGKGGAAWRKRLWYWVAAIYVVAAVPVFLILL